MNIDPLALLRLNERELKQRFGIKKIGIFGSFVHCNVREDSDVDVLVTFEKGKKSFDNFMGLKFYLEEIFNRKVDLVTEDALKPLIRDPILNEVVYA
ncbi:nucleotidyltransferase family protein [Methanospirillum stamsii]|uniref:nucleotidyltransferase family protein n=1 Tax=Methanospirillum stamsii TaxID=1277351 RepID=UPI0026960AA5